MMTKTRLSLFYLVGYLFPAGLGLLLAPRPTAKLLLSNAEYDTIMLRLAGMFLLGLGIIVMQLIRLRNEALYPTTLVVRVFFCVCISVFYFMSGDPLFLVMLGIVGLGVLLTGSCYLVDRRREGTVRAAD
ncbi:MAG: hypothetical protein EHM35_21060 [Planctomycetaceae bacterium]|nr:MAG: hypothetical protein EHM35_21060 [Planctomycetaceae bacterium]